MVSYGVTGILYSFLLQKPTEVKWTMDIFSLLDTLSKSSEKREPQ